MSGDQLEPRHDAPLCDCGAPVQPSAYWSGMLRPRPPGPWPANMRGSHDNLSILRCVSSGAEFQADQVRVLQAWHSAGAHEQHVLDESKAATLRTEHDEIRSMYRKLQSWVDDNNPLICRLDDKATELIAGDAGDSELSIEEQLGALAAVLSGITAVCQEVLDDAGELGAEAEEIGTRCVAAMYEQLVPG